MLSGAVTGMPLQSITRKSLRKPADQRISRFLGQNTGGSDRCLLTVAADDGALRSGPGAKGENTIHKHQLRGLGKPLKSTEHGKFSRHPDALGVHLSGRPLAKCPARGMGFDLWHQGSPSSWRQGLAVSQAKNGELLRSGVAEADRRSENRSEPASTANLVNADNHSLAAEERRRRRPGRASSGDV